MSSFKTIIALPVDAPLPTSAAVSVMEDGIISASAVEAKHELIVQDGEYACKSTFIVGAGADADGTGEMAIKVEVEVKTTANDGGKKVIKVKVNSSSCKQLLPLQSAEHNQAPQADDEVAATNFKLKLD